MRARVLLAFLLLTLCGWPSTNIGGDGSGTPPGDSYNWELGAIASYASRLTTAVQWDNGSWADPYDTEQELIDADWQVIAIPTCTDLWAGAETPQVSDGDTPDAPDGLCDSDRSVGISCAQGAAGTGTDEAGIIALLSAACPSSDGSGRRDCAIDAGGLDNGTFDREGVALKFPTGTCYIDMLAGTGGPNTVGGLPIPYSNIAIIGRGMDQSYLNCNDSGGTESSTYSTCVGTTFPFGTQWSADPITPCAPSWDSDMPYGGTCEDTSNVETLTAAVSVGQTTIRSTSACTSIDADDRVLLKGTGLDGLPLWHLNEAASDCDGSNDIVLKDPIRYAIPGTVTAVEIRKPQTRKTFFMGLSIGFPNAPDGTSRGTSITSAHHLYFNHPSEVLVTDSRVGPYIQFAYGDIGSFRVSIRHSEIGPSQKSKRRGTNGRVFHFGESTVAGSYSVFDNVFVGAAKRFVEGSQMSTHATWYGFNYMDDMLATAPETGSHWNAVGNPQGITHSPDAGTNPAAERTVFMSHDTNNTSKPGMLLVEANDMGGHFNNQNIAGAFNRYMTFYRNRQNRLTLCGNRGAGTVPPLICTIGFDTGGGDPAHTYQNWIANRWSGWETTTRLTYVLGLWNIAQDVTSDPEMTGTGVVWDDTAAPGRNYGTTAAHEEWPLVDGLPPSLALQQDTAPEWWCQESGSWDGDWSFAIGDGYGGTTYKLPAQIKYEIREGLGGTCTPP
jgi:hypothetical protein